MTEIIKEMKGHSSDDYTGHQEEKNKNGSAQSLIDSDEFLVLEDIVCYGSDGKPFEQYDRIELAKDVVRSADKFYDNAKTVNRHVRFTPYEAISHFEKQKKGLFLPSFALQCVVLVRLYENRNDHEVERVLMQYKDYGAEYGWHNNNTVVNGEQGMIIHYPCDSDFLSQGGDDRVNEERKRIQSSFPRSMDCNRSNFEDALEDSVKLNYMKELTGLKNPQVLIDIASYYGMTSMLWPADNSICSVCLGGSHSFFNINVSAGRDNYYAARGVRVPGK
ncbi:hypothetical protein HQ545_06425 [Candidatus Woesearchaeota archaeon]|nr:hypothetical protein [Candidatus Woesearchaeota archaeon]